MAATTWFTLATPILSDRCSPCLRCNSHLKKTEENLNCSSCDFGTGKGNGNQADSGSSHRCRDCEAQGGEALSTFLYFHIVTVVKGIKCLMHACCCPCADYLCFGFIICFFHRDPLSLMSRRDTEWCEQSNGWTR